MNRLLRISRIVIPVWITLLFIADIVVAFYPRPIWVGREPDALFVADFVMLLVLVITSIAIFIAKLWNKRKSGPINLRFNNSFDALNITLIYFALIFGSFIIVAYLFKRGDIPFIIATVFMFLAINNYSTCFMNGMCEGGVIVSGAFYPWTRIAAYATLNDTVYLLIRRRKEGDPRLLERPIVSYSGEDLAGYLESRGIRRQPQPAGSYDNHKSDGV